MSVRKTTISRTPIGPAWASRRFGFSGFFGDRFFERASPPFSAGFWRSVSAKLFAAAGPSDPTATGFPKGPTESVRSCIIMHERTDSVGPFGKPVAVGSDGPAAANNFALTERQKPAEKGGEARSKNRSPKKPEKPKRRLAQAGPIGVREIVVFRTLIQ